MRSRYSVALRATLACSTGVAPAIPVQPKKAQRPAFVASLYAGLQPSIPQQTWKLASPEVILRSEERMPGTLTSAGTLLFSGDDEHVVALHSAIGKTLWHTWIGAVGNGPERYLRDSKHLLAAGETQLFALGPNQPVISQKKNRHG